MTRCRLAVCLLAAAMFTAVEAQPPGRRADSPASSPIPATAMAQEYSPELIEAGRTVFSAQCGFCHGLDAGGGSQGPDLTRSELVAGDYMGDAMIPVIRGGRLDADIPMPGFSTLSESQLDSLVAFIHDQKTRAESVEGGRQSVRTEDVLSGDAGAGRRYFERNCADCHSADGDLAGIASRMQGLNLLQRMLNPGSRRGGSSVRATPRITVTTADNETYVGLLDYRDEFVVVLTDAEGRYRSFSTRNVQFQIDDPLARHMELLGQYTDDDMHDVLAYLHTLQ